ncbi:hypothetical protein [Terriglobus roseus]|nr:hypothetical protein [Terriglobus roseus]
MTACFGSLAAAQTSSAAPVQSAGSSVAGGQPERDLDASGISNLGPEERFRISVPLRPSIPVNLGAARLDVSLTRKIKGKKAEEDLHLVAVLGVAQASLKPGDKSVTLHGVTPAFDGERAGEYRASDYSVHFGSGNVTNLGTPDESFIDTDALTNKLQSLRIYLATVAGK